MKTIIKSTAIFTLLLIIGLSISLNAIYAQATIKKVYIKINVDGLSCPFCAYGMEKKLKQVAGSENVYIKLIEGEATLDVPESQKPSEDELRKIVADAGFTAREIIYSDKPFKINSDE